MTKEEFMKQYGDKLYDAAVRLVKEKGLECAGCNKLAEMLIEGFYFNHDGKWHVGSLDGHSYGYQSNLEGWSRITCSELTANGVQLTTKKTLCPDCSKEYNEEMNDLLASMKGKAAVDEDDES